MRARTIGDFVQRPQFARLRRRRRQLRCLDLPRDGLERDLPRQDGRRHAFPERPLQRRLLPAALCRPDLRPRPAQPADRAADERHRQPVSGPAERSTPTTRNDVYETIMDPDLTLALCRGDAEEVDRRLPADRRLRHLAESRASPPRSTMSAIPRRAPARCKAENDKRRAAGPSRRLPRGELLRLAGQRQAAGACRRCSDNAAKVATVFRG